MVLLVAVSAREDGTRASQPAAPRIFAPILPTDSDQQKVALGRDLFFDPRLSQSKQMNCASCHDLTTNGATNSALDRGDSGQPMEFNTPTLFNSAYNFRFGWAGKNRTMRAQVLSSLRNGLNGADGLAAQRLAADPAMLRRFRAIYRSDPTESNVVDALSAFVVTLVTPDSPFDRWLKGDARALTSQQQRGYMQFEKLGCANCHQGRNIGANVIGRRGVFNPLGNPNPPYLRVPSLRNVAVTAPYFHDGSGTTLRSAIRQMARAQLDIAISDNDLRDIVAFLGSLTGTYEGVRLQPAIKNE